MGRAFEYRKARKMKRWSSMAKVFTRITKDIIMAVKESGPSPDANSRLKALMQNARDANMPKGKRRTRHQAGLQQRPGGLQGDGVRGLTVPTALRSWWRRRRTIRPARWATFDPTLTSATVAWERAGSVEFMFDRKCFFKMAKGTLDLEEFEFEMIDFGVEEIFEEHDEGKGLGSHHDLRPFC